MERDYSPDNQKLLEGSVWASLAWSPLNGEIEMDADGNYTGRIIIRRPSGPWVVTVAPAPDVPDA